MYRNVQPYKPLETLTTLETLKSLIRGHKPPPAEVGAERVHPARLLGVPEHVDEPPHGHRAGELGVLGHQVRVVLRAQQGGAGSGRQDEEESEKREEEEEEGSALGRGAGSEREEEEEGGDVRHR